MQIPKYKIDYLRDKFNNLKNSGKEIVFDATYIRGREKEKLIEHAPIRSLSKLNKLLEFENYDKIKIEIFDLNTSEIKPHNIEVINLKSEQTLGQAEINKFEKYVQERERERQFQEMQEKLSGLQEENDIFREQVDQQAQEINDLENQIKSKAKFQHYAGILGEIINKIGIKSEKINAITGLFGIDDFEPLNMENQVQDNSGIIEENEESTPQLNPQQQKKIELIQIIADYLYQMDIKILGLVFAIFSEIEQNPQSANQILLFLNQYKKVDNEQNNI